MNCRILYVVWSYPSFCKNTRKFNISVTFLRKQHKCEFAHIFTKTLDKPLQQNLCFLNKNVNILIFLQKCLICTILCILTKIKIFFVVTKIVVFPYIFTKMYNFTWYCTYIFTNFIICLDILHSNKNCTLQKCEFN